MNRPYTNAITLIILAAVFALPIFSHVQAQKSKEPKYDYDNLRMRYFHLLHLHPGEDATSNPNPNPGRRATPTPAATPVPGTITNTRFVVVGGAQQEIGTATYSQAQGYRMRITNRVPVNKNDPNNLLYMWLLDGTNAFEIQNFTEASVPLTDRTFQADLTSYSELIVTEEDPNANINLPSNQRVITIRQELVGVTTPAPPTPTPQNTPQPTPPGTSETAGQAEQPSGLRGLLQRILSIFF